MESLSAYELKAALAGYGNGVSVGTDSSSVPNKVILIGETSATTERMPSGNQYCIKVDANGTIQVCAGNYYGYRAALARIEQELASHNGIFVGGYEGTANVANVDRASADSIRVMFYNIFGWNNWPYINPDYRDTKTGKIIDGNGNEITKNEQIIENTIRKYATTALAPPEALRQDLQLDLIRTYAPDVIGFQEYMSYSVWSYKYTGVSDYHGKFTALMTSIGYTKVDAGGPDSNELKNCTPMFYNDEKLELVDCGFELYDQTNDTCLSKGLTWAIFRVKTGEDAGKLISVFNTHFAHASSSEGGDLAREDNANQFLEVMAAVLARKAEYKGIPVIMGGDLNFWNIWGNYDKQTSAEMIAQRESETKPYNALKDGGMTAAFNVAGVQTNGKSSAAGYTDSYHGYSDYSVTDKIYDTNKTTIVDTYTLDYIFVENESAMNVQKYFVIEDDISLRASDHSPTFTDISLK